MRLKKEVLDESIRGNAKQRVLVGANSLTGDQWYVQQASRSAHACWLCCAPAIRTLYMILYWHRPQHLARNGMLAQ